MNTFSLTFKRTLSIFLALLTVGFLALVFLTPKQNAQAEGRFIIKNKDLFRLDGALREKRLTNDKNIQIIFDQQNSKVLFGKGWGNENEGEGMRIGGTELWIYDQNLDTFSRIQEGFEGEWGVLSPDNRVFYTTRHKDLFVSNVDGSQKKKLQEKVHFPNISPDGGKLVYQKLSPDWSLGQYFDGALGLTILNIDSNQEIRIATISEDWAAIFSPNGKKILFVGANDDGYGGFASMNLDGSERTILANKEMKVYSNDHIPLPSEKPLFSDDGRFLLYENDRAVWVLRFNADFTKIEKAKRVAYGVSPQWVPDGKSFSLTVLPDAGKKGVLKINLPGEFVK